MARNGGGDGGGGAGARAGGKAACIGPPSLMLLAGGGRAQATVGLAWRGLFDAIALVVAVISSYSRPGLVGWLVRYNNQNEKIDYLPYLGWHWAIQAHSSARAVARMQGIQRTHENQGDDAQACS